MGSNEYDGIAKFDGTNWVKYTGFNSDLPFDRITSLLQTGDGNIYAGTQNNGVVKFDGVNWTEYNTSNSVLPDNYVKSLLQTTNDDIWVGTYFCGLAIIHSENGGGQNISNDNYYNSHGVKVYPNPTSSNVTINYQPQGNGELYVYNITGKEVLQKELTLGKNTIATNKLESGVYFYRVVSEEGVVGNGKLVVFTP